MRQRAAWAMCLVIGATVACADVALSPSTPDTIELTNFAAPAIVVGDSLRDVDGVAAPAVAIVRNQQGDVLADAQIRYAYADISRDTALVVDQMTGFIVALKALAASGTKARIVARVGSRLQVFREVLVTIRPDSADRVGSQIVAPLTTTLPDTGTASAAANSSSALSVTVRHTEGELVSLVPNWLVKYELLEPANPTNDSTQSVFLVNEARAMSNTDTTDGSGIATRYVRVRSSRFPLGNGPDSVRVRVSVTYRGSPVKGSPISFVVPVVKAATTP